MKYIIKNPYHDETQMKEAMYEIIRNLTPYPFPYMKGQVSTLGGVNRSSIMFRVSLQSKDKWKNGIFENSPYAHISIDYNGVMEMFSGCLQPKLRKKRIKGVNEIIAQLHMWGERVLSQY